MKIGWGKDFNRHYAVWIVIYAISFFCHVCNRYLSKTVSTYFPTQVTDVFTQGRDFATAVLPMIGYSPISVITTIQRTLKYAFSHYHLPREPI